jgi:hypothetical protein
MTDVKRFTTFGPEYDFSTLACILGLFSLPSGGSYCRTALTNLKTFDDANAYCKSIGLSGLLEFQTLEDVVTVAGINTC